MNKLALFVAALMAGASYVFSWAFYLPEWIYVLWKGAGVGLLAMWASQQGRSTDHRLLAGVLTLGASADMMLEVQFILGASLFAVGHVLAIILYVRHRRPEVGVRGIALSGLLVVGLMALAYGLAGPVWGPAVAVYTLFLGTMFICAAWSRFALAALGAVLFVLSDLIIFGGMGQFQGLMWADIAIWTLYFGGQCLIAWGVVRGLAKPKGI